MNNLNNKLLYMNKKKFSGYVKINNLFKANIQMYIENKFNNKLRRRKKNI